MPFVAVLVFWLAIIFASFSLFARLNPTLIVALVMFALSSSAALFLIAEMSEPFSGLLQIPSASWRTSGSHGCGANGDYHDPIAKV